MAAKQGLSAQISQASEDAKRAVLNRTNLSSSLWFSNLNTTCTIKSAPPRTPDVLNMLATKSGWLLKRNEQHVWQSRYCCVVPHTFLYYFDAASPPPGNGDGHPHHGGGTAQPPLPPHQQSNLTPKQQDMLNKAVRQGYGKRGAAKSQQPRSSLYHVLGTAGGGNSTPAGPVPMVGGGSGGNNDGFDDDIYHHLQDQPAVAVGGTPHNLQPAGIIDLECYTTVHRNSQNKMLLELAGDESVNPDLRSFYFCASSEDEGELWTQSFLSQRHSSLIDEKEAYQQVCDGFAQQLQLLHTELDGASRQMEEQQEELYRVRSSMEDMRRNCWRLVQDTLERTDTGPPQTGVPAAKKAYRTDLETIQAQDLGLLAAVQLLCDYTRVLEETVSDCTEKTTKLEEQLEQAQEGDQSRVKDLEREIEQIQSETNQQQTNLHGQLETLQQKYIQSQKECQDVQKELASQRLEMTMYQSATRTKIGDLQSHKKILKKEVIELRQKIEEVHSELDLVKHKQSSSKLELAQERQKAHLLERYVEKMESQVKVQQNMMEMMSQAGSVAGDYYSQGPGGGGGSAAHPGSPGVRGAQSYTTTTTRDYANAAQREYGTILMNTPSDVRVDTEDDNDDDGDVGNNNGNDQDIDPECDIDRLNIDLMGDGNHRHDHPHHHHHHHHRTTPSPSSKKSSSRRTIDDDNKSHMSELTEDRTQKQFDAAYLYQQHPSAPMQVAVPTARPLVSPRSGMMLPYNVGGPPAVIGVSEKGIVLEEEEDAPTTKPTSEGRDNQSTPSKQPKLDTIMVSHSSATFQRSSSARRNEIPRYHQDNMPVGGGHGGSGSSYSPGYNGGGRRGGNDTGSVSSYGNKPKLSVAQRARLEADQHTTPIRIRMGNNNNNHNNNDNQSTNTPLRGNNASPLRSSSARRGRQPQVLAPNSQSLGSSNNSVGSGFFANLGKKLESAIDQSIIGVGRDSESVSSGSSSSVSDDGGHQNESSRNNTNNNNNGAGYRQQERVVGNVPYRRNSSGSMGGGNNEDDRNSGNVVVHEEKKSSETASVSSSANLSLHERQAMQRAQQVQFLKNQGLIQNEMEVRGGPGAASPRNNTGDSSSSVTSFSSRFSGNKQR